MDVSATATKATADMIKVSDNLQGFSTKLEAASVVVGFFADGVGFATGAVASISEYLSKEYWIRKGAAWWMGDQKSDDGKLNPNAPPWTQFLDDVRDGKFDGKGNAGEFFTKDFE